MPKITTVGLIITLEEQSIFFRTIDGNPENYMGLIQRTAPLLTYVNHKLDLYTSETDVPSNIRYLNQTIIQSESLVYNGGDSITHNISVQFPPIIVNNDSIILNIIDAIEQALKKFSQNAYVEGDYSPIDTVRMILAKEINNVFAQVLWKTPAPIVHSGVAESFWYKGQLLAEFEMPIMSIWKQDTSVISPDYVRYPKM